MDPKKPKDPKFPEKALEVAMSNRDLEIGLFWSRSLFFSGVTAAAMIGYTALVEGHPHQAAVVAGFGLVSAVVWTLANRGSKYWQENWEQKVDHLETEIIGDLHKHTEPPLKKGWWLRARRYSVTKLAIALSDFAAVIWLCVLIGSLMRLTGYVVSDYWRERLTIGGIAASVGFALALLWFGKSRPVKK